ncbi:unnamed protein product, partial [Durusdinium trenchii]
MPETLQRARDLTVEYGVVEAQGSRPGACQEEDTYLPRSSAQVPVRSPTAKASAEVSAPPPAENKRSPEECAREELKLKGSSHKRKAEGKEEEPAASEEEAGLEDSGAKFHYLIGLTAVDLSGAQHYGGHVSVCRYITGVGRDVNFLEFRALDAIVRAFALKIAVILRQGGPEGGAATFTPSRPKRPGESLQVWSSALMTAAEKEMKSTDSRTERLQPPKLHLRKQLGETHVVFGKNGLDAIEDHKGSPKESIERFQPPRRADETKDLLKLQDRGSPRAQAIAEKLCKRTMQLKVELQACEQEERMLRQRLSRLGHQSKAHRQRQWERQALHK